MMCDGCGAALADADLHLRFHRRLDAPRRRETFTCGQCFAEVLESSRAAHRWWHVGIAELVTFIERRDTSRPEPPPSQE